MPKTRATQPEIWCVKYNTATISAVSILMKESVVLRFFFMAKCFLMWCFKKYFAKVRDDSESACNFCYSSFSNLI